MRKAGRLAGTTITAFWLLQGGPAPAQQVMPPTLDQGQIERRFVEPRRPEVLPETEIRRPEDAAARADTRPLFSLVAVEVEGATVYSAADLAPLYREFLSREVSYRDIGEIAQRITARYRADGYVLSRAVVPVQRIEAGIVRIQVIEGFIDGLRMEGETQGSSELLWRYLMKIRNSRPLRAADLERYLLLANDLPGITARALLTPSASVPGASDLVLRVSQSRVEGFASLDNRGTRYVGPYQLQVGAGLNTVQSRTRIRGITASQGAELRYAELAHDEHFGDEGTALAFALRRTLSEPGYTLKPFEFRSDSTSSDIVLSHPLLRSRRENLRLTGTFSYRDSDAQILGTALSSDRLGVLRVGGTWDFVDRWVGINQFGIELSRGLHILGATETGSRLLSRSNGHSDFSKMTFQAQRLQRLAQSWSLLGGVNGQVAGSPLLVSEEYSVGGSDYGRAYDPSELTGDGGLSLKLELRRALALPSALINAGQLYGFYDAGKVRNRAPVAGERRAASLASAGFGTRFDLRDGFAASLEIAFPLTRKVAAMGDSGSGPRVFFSLSRTFSRGAQP